MAICILYFIQKHRDTEKAEGMFGTLVIQLPSNYSGGKLIVYHQRKKLEFDYSGPSCRSNCYFTSFYADCQHEVKKVTKGIYKTDLRLGFCQHVSNISVMILEQLKQKAYFVIIQLDVPRP